MLGELNEAQIDQLLRSEVIGRIGCHQDGRTYVVPVTYYYDGQALYGHSGVGLKIRMMRANPHVCFEVDHLENMANWQSVIMGGVYEELSGAEAQQAMQMLVNRLLPLIASESSQPSHGLEAGGHRADTAGHQAVVYRIRVQEKTGRYEKR